jgi:hypothetical protein
MIILIINYFSSLCRSQNHKLRLAGKALSHVDALGDKVKSELHAGWLAYICKTFTVGVIVGAALVVEDALVLPDYVVEVLGLYAH